MRNKASTIQHATYSATEHNGLLGNCIGCYDHKRGKKRTKNPYRKKIMKNKVDNVCTPLTKPSNPATTRQPTHKKTLAKNVRYQSTTLQTGWNFFFFLCPAHHFETSSRRQLSSQKHKNNFRNHPTLSRKR